MPAAPNRLFLWKYKNPTQGYLGYHITGSDGGLDAVLTKLTSQQHALKKSILFSSKLSPVTEHELAVPGFKGKAKAFSELEICVALGDVADRFQITETGEHCEIALSEARLPEFLNGLEDIKRGKGDYAMSGDASVLWFWWRLGD